jgi:dCMP deaminase
VTRPSRDETGILLAHIWAQRATCVRRQVGCVLFDADGYQLSAGYNGPASGEPHCTEHPCPGAGLQSGTGLDACEALHAEWSALQRCPDPRHIAVCYVTVSPCVTCTKMLLNTACRRIVFTDEYPHEAAAVMWRRSGRSWEQLA